MQKPMKMKNPPNYHLKQGSETNRFTHRACRQCVCSTGRTKTYATGDIDKKIEVDAQEKHLIFKK